jgi:hypothetical protein
MVDTLDYSRFRFEAVIDWLRIAICTARSTNLQAVRNCIAEELGIRVHVEPFDADSNPLPKGSANSPASHFQITLQDPQGWHQVDAPLKRLEAHYGFTAHPMVIGAEIAFDAYSAGASPSEMALLSAAFCKFQINPVSENRRVVGVWSGKPRAKGLSGVKYGELCGLMEKGASVYFGSQRDMPEHSIVKTPISQRAYFKRTTTAKGQVEQLEECEWRSRLELTLQMGERGLTGKDGLPCTDWRHWQEYRFETLRGGKHFRFMKFKDNLEDQQLSSSDRKRLDDMNDSTQVGEWREAKRKQADGRIVRTPQHDRFLQADAELNERARRALRKLTREWRKEQTPVKRK